MRRVRGSSAREPGAVRSRRELVDPSGAAGLGRGEVQKRRAPSLQYRSGSQSSSAELGPGPGALAKRSPESRRERTVVSRPGMRARAHAQAHTHARPLPHAAATPAAAGTVPKKGGGLGAQQR